MSKLLQLTPARRLTPMALLQELLRELDGVDVPLDNLVIVLQWGAALQVRSAGPDTTSALASIGLLELGIKELAALALPR